MVGLKLEGLAIGRLRLAVTFLSAESDTEAEVGQNRIGVEGDDLAEERLCLGGASLVVEDDTLVRKSVVAQIESLGYAALAACSADEALDLIDQTAKLDLLFTDTIMPGGMNGRQLVDEALKRRPALKILYTSGYSEDVVVHQGRLDAGVLLLVKPYRKTELARMIRVALGS